MRRLLFVAIAILCGMTGVSHGCVRCETNTDPQKERLQAIDRILLGSLALTDQGKVDTASLQDLIAKRFPEIGHTVASNATQPHDVIVKLNCEQRKIWGGTFTSRGDEDLPDSPIHLWKGLACQPIYLLDGKTTQWKKEIRTNFPDVITATEQAKASDPGPFALGHLKYRFEE